jgi:hypothetical protein
MNCCFGNASGSLNATSIDRTLADQPSEGLTGNKDHGAERKTNTWIDGRFAGRQIRTPEIARILRAEPLGKARASSFFASPIKDYSE